MSPRARVGAALVLLLLAGCGVRAQDEPQRLPRPESTPKPVPTLKESVCPSAPSFSMAPRSTSDPSPSPTGASTGSGACSTVASTK